MKKRSKRKRDEKEEEEEEDEAEGEEEHGDEGEEEEEDEAEGEEEHGDEGEVGVEGGEGAGRDEAEEVARVGDDSEANIVKDSNDIEETDKMEDAFATSYYQEREYLEKSHIAIDDEEDWEEETAPFEPVLPSLENSQAVLEWIYAELKDVCSMPVILQALQSIMRGGEDAEDSNIVVSLCEDDQEDFYSNPASADGNRVPAEEVENVVMESEEEKTEGAPTSCFLSIENAEDSNIFISHSKANPASADGKFCFLSIIDSEGSGSSSSATASKMYTSEYSSAASDAAATAEQFKLYEDPL